jgi:hypothetical protein
MTALRCQWQDAPVVAARIQSCLHYGTWRALFDCIVKFPASLKHLRRCSRFAAVVVMLSLWVGMCALEVSPELHHFLHKDSQSPAHNCLVTKFQHHSVLSGFAPALAPASPRDCDPLVIYSDFPLFASFDYRLSPSRAPPAV